MASVRQTGAGKFELCIRSKLLPKGRVYFTFADRDAAETYGAQADGLLASGIVPSGLVPEDKFKPVMLLGKVIRDWISSGRPAATDAPVLNLLHAEVGDLPVDQITYAWAEGWVQSLKLKRGLAPGTIRKRVASLSRAIDWHLRMFPDVMVGNPLRMLPRGTASYSAQDARTMVAAGKAPRADVDRDRRLEPGELDRIMAALAGDKRDDRERALELKHGPALRLLFLLILRTGLRLREAYTLSRGQFLMDARVIRARSSKQWHGRVKYREVPMSPELHRELLAYFSETEPAPDALLFPWWDGDRDLVAMARVTTRLSAQFARLFDYAQCPGLTEHDLRHEATCGWLEMRRPDGQWLYHEREIDRIMGWAPGSKMGAKYASFRAADLASRMWEPDQAVSRAV